MLLAMVVLTLKVLLLAPQVQNCDPAGRHGGTSRSCDASCSSLLLVLEAQLLLMVEFYQKRQTLFCYRVPLLLIAVLHTVMAVLLLIVVVLPLVSVY